MTGQIWVRGSLRSLGDRLGAVGHPVSAPTVGRLLKGLGYSLRVNSLGRAVPYGVYDLSNNRGLIYLGSSGDTPAFATDAIAAWWQTDGRATWPTGDHLLLLADAGGSNNCRTRAWKERVQVQLCDRLGLTVTVCHYPTGCSKWNPIERRLFSHISNNWAGVPLRTWDTLLAFIRGTTTAPGLTVQAIFQDGDYPTGQKVTDAEMAALRIQPHAICPQWNYTIRPRTPCTTQV